MMNEKLTAPMQNILVIIIDITNGLFSSNKSRIFPKIVVVDSCLFIANSFTKKIRIMIAVAPGLSKKRKIPEYQLFVMLQMQPKAKILQISG